MVDEKLNAVKKLKILQDVSALFKIIFEREGDVKIRVDTHITDTAKYVRGVVVVVVEARTSGAARTSVAVVVVVVRTSVAARTSVAVVGGLRVDVRLWMDGSN